MVRVDEIDAAQQESTDALVACLDEPAGVTVNVVDGQRYLARVGPVNISSPSTNIRHATHSLQKARAALERKPSARKQRPRALKLAWPSTPGAATHYGWRTPSRSISIARSARRARVSGRFASPTHSAYSRR